MLYKINRFIVLKEVKNDKVILKTPMDVIEIKSENTGIIIEIINFFKKAATIDALINEYNYSDVKELLTNLIDKKILIEESEIDENISNTHSFIQQFANVNDSKISDITNLNITILGSSHTIYFLTKDLNDIGFGKVSSLVIDDGVEEILKDIYQNKINLLVYFSDTYSLNLVRTINKKCIEHNIPFVLGYFKNLYAVIGPIIIPNETPCINCLELRKINNYDFTDLERYYIREYYNLENQSELYPEYFFKGVSKLTALEIYKFYLNKRSCNIIGKELEINLKDYTTRYNKILYNPQCQICND